MDRTLEGCNLEDDVNHRTAGTGVAQLGMPGMSSEVCPYSGATPRSVFLGQEVLYFGKVGGGPRHGARGVVKQMLRHRAIVDLGKSGTWSVPYWFLTVPMAA